MTDITTLFPIALRRRYAHNPALPKRGIGSAISAMSKAVLQAFEMVYVAPYQHGSEQPPVVIDPDLEGRDPSW